MFLVRLLAVVLWVAGVIVLIGAADRSGVASAVSQHPWMWHRVLDPLLNVPAALALLILGGVFWLLHKLVRWRAKRKLEASTPLTLPAQEEGAKSELAIALSSCRGAILGVAVFSAVSNVLVLTGALFMLEIYDRVLPGRSVPTLVGLAVLAFVLLAAQGGLDVIRTQLLGRIGARLDANIDARVYDSMVRLQVRTGGGGDGLQATRDLDGIRTFLSSMGPTALFDLPWIPFYIAIIFAFHSVLGVAALAGAIVLVLLTILTELLTRRPIQAASGHAASRHKLAEASRRNAEVLTAMGFAHRLGARWTDANRNYIAAHLQASDVGGRFGTLSRTTRLILQSGVLGLGAYLVIQEDASAGIIIAAAILTGRALAPVDLAIAHWKGFVAARQSWRRLRDLLTSLPKRQALMALPKPATSLSVEGVSIVPPSEQRLVVQDITFQLAHGQGLGIVGPSGSGKTSLARVLVGAWIPARGKVRLDGCALDQWRPELLGPHIGYLPQDVELFAGTIAENIARFDRGADPEAIINAARSADVHDLIVRLPMGYDTEIGEQGAGLSAGQRQRIGLARALFGDPFLVVLDEPDSNLDVDGVAAVSRAVLGIRTRGGIAIVIAHRHEILTNIDLLLALDKGRVAAAGPKEAVISKLKQASQRPEPLKVVSDSSKGT